jgi:hypothetical protein
MRHKIKFAALLFVAMAAFTVSCNQPQPKTVTTEDKTVTVTEQPGQFPLPKTAADVPGPVAGSIMTREYVQSVGRTAYLFAWPLVNAAHRNAAMSQAPEPGLMGGILPLAHNAVSMLTDYISPGQRFVTCPNQDVVYGFGFSDLDMTPLVLQIPDFGDRFWVYALYDQRTDEFSRIGKAYGTKPGFYLLVGPNWNGEKPDGITAVVRSSTALVATAPRIFQSDLAEDKAAIQPVLSQIVFYPLAQFDGKMKTKDWTKTPHFPAPASAGKGETKWVNPETFFDELSDILKRVPPLPGEEALYAQIYSVLDAAAKDPTIKKTLTETAIAAEQELIAPLFQWGNNGGPAGNGWNTQLNAAQWGNDYLNRAEMAKSSMYGNRPEETKYYYTVDEQLDGRNLYSITFPKGQVPPVKGFWSVTLYNEYHLFEANPLNRFSLGTKSTSLQYNPDGSLTLYASAKSPGKDKESNWLPAPMGQFSLFLRAYWPEKEILDGTWMPPKVVTVK